MAEIKGVYMDTGFWLDGKLNKDIHNNEHYEQMLCIIALKYRVDEDIHMLINACFT